MNRHSFKRRRLLSGVWRRLRQSSFAVLFLVAGFESFTSLAAESRVARDLEYARAGDISLKLDLYLPANVISPPVVVWVHGGAWRGGSKNNPSILPLTEKGFAVASVDYRLSPVAQFPAQIHDIKAAIRYLRGTAKEHGISAERIAISGGSAGGHLAALVGVTNGVKELEGDLGDYRNKLSDVQGIVVFYGASNLTTILAQSTPHGVNMRTPALELLLGGQPDSKPDLARLASPVFQVDKADPPLWWYHGDQDPQMPVNQALEMLGAYKKLGLDVTFEPVFGGGHGGKLFYTPEQFQQVAKFLDSTLKKE
ncbi:MAG TPA: alpha/beta hydrolase [Pirellulaceae bacterium]|jgi:acetyl esterase/lipase